MGGQRQQQPGMDNTMQPPQGAPGQPPGGAKGGPANPADAERRARMQAEMAKFGGGGAAVTAPATFKNAAMGGMRHAQNAAVSAMAKRPRF